MSSTIVRVKRRLEESPLDALVLHCKRLKTEDESQLTPSVFVFSGTVDENDHTEHIKKAWLKPADKTHLLDTTKNIPELLNKLREDHKDSVLTNRIKILNYSRGLSFVDNTEQASNQYDVLDLHHSKEESEKPKTEKTEHYAYDLYLSHQKDFEVEMLDDIVRIDPYQGDLIFGSYRDNGRKSPSEDEMEEDEDSNDENNWRNEYPDTDDSIQEEDMRNAMKNCSLEDQLSSDDGEDELVYGNASTKDKTAYRKVDQDDVDRYGLPYAMYKAKLKSKKLIVDGEPCLIEELEDETVERNVSAETSENSDYDEYENDENSDPDELD